MRRLPMRVDLFTGTVGAFDIPRRLLTIGVWITLMATVPVVGVLFCFAAIALEWWLLYPGRVWREFEVDQEGVSLIYREKVAVRIPWHQMRSVYQPLSPAVSLRSQETSLHGVKSTFEKVSSGKSVRTSRPSGS